MAAHEYLLNITDSQNLNILQKIKEILGGDIEYPTNNILDTDFIKNELTPRFKKCIEYLTEIFFDNSVFKQEVIIKNLDNVLERSSTKSIEKSHHKIMALIYLLYLNELYVHFILYKPINESGSTTKVSTGINLLTSQVWANSYNNGTVNNPVGLQPINNLALSLWSWSKNSTKYKMYKESIIDALSFNKDTNGIHKFLNKIDNLCVELDNEYKRFILALLKNINNHFQNNESLKNITITSIYNALFYIMDTPPNLTEDEIRNVDTTNIQINVNNLRSDWIDSLKSLIKSCIKVKSKDDGWETKDDGWGAKDDGWETKDDGWGTIDDGWEKKSKVENDLWIESEDLDPEMKAYFETDLRTLLEEEEEDENYSDPKAIKDPEVTRNPEDEIKEQQAIEMIEKIIHESLVSMNSDYTTDSNSIFSWLYLGFNNETKKYSSCINQTILEQYILCRIYYPTNKFGIGMQYQNNLGHIYYSYTKKELNSNDIAHWTSSYIGYYSNQKYDLRFVLNDPTLKNGRIYNLSREPYMYIISTIYITFDYAQNFLILNKCRTDNYNIVTMNYSRYFDYLTSNINNIYQIVRSIISNFKNLSTIKMVTNLKKQNYIIDNNQLANTTDIVDYIINTNEKFTEHNSLYNILIEQEEGKTDDTVFLKNIATNFVSNLYFSTNESLLNYIKLINTLINNALEIYFTKKIKPLIRSNAVVSDYIIFVFKGGNALRLIFLQQIKNFAKEINILNNDIKQYFKKTDNDFSIYIKNIPNADMNEINENIINIVYLVLNRIRNIIILDLPKYLSYYNYNNEKKEKLLNTLFLELVNDKTIPNNKYTKGQFIRIESDDIFVNDTNTIIDNDFNNYCSNKSIIENTDPKTLFGTVKSQNGRRDFGISNDIHNNIILNGIDFLQEKKTKYNQLFDTTYQSILYKNIFASNLPISVNRSISTFDLVRTKINFKLYYEEDDKIKPINIGGELIDISIVKENTDDFFDKRKEFYKNYELVNDNGDIINIFSYSLKYYIADLLQMIWNIEKSGTIPIRIDLMAKKKIFSMPWFSKIKRLHRVLIIFIFDYIRYNPSTKMLNITNDYIIDETVPKLNTLLAFLNGNTISAENKDTFILRLNQKILSLNFDEYLDEYIDTRQQELVNIMNLGNINIVKFINLIPEYCLSFIKYLELFISIDRDIELNEETNFNDFIKIFFDTMQDINTKKEFNSLYFDNIENRDLIFRNFLTQDKYTCINNFKQEFINTLNIIISYLNKLKQICNNIIANKSEVNIAFNRTASSFRVET